MQLTLKQIATKIFIALMALQIINLSIDSVEFQPIEAAVTIGDFNYLNSMTEYVSEVIMGMKDAFPEFQNQSSSSKSQIVKHLSIKLFEDNIIITTPDIVCLNNSYSVPLNESFKYMYLQEINPPPPKYC
jgi:hypothetical protein